MNMHNDHEWAASRLTRFSAGLLPENEMLAMQAHLDACGECATLLAPVRAANHDEAGHLPASLIATWNRSAQRLSTGERELVRRHLERCDSCRQTLVFAGHSPELPALVQAPVRAPKRSMRWELRQWAFGLTAVAAAAAAWMLVVQPAMRPRDPRVSATMGGARLDAAVVWFEPLGAGASLPADAIVLPTAGVGSPVELEPRAFQNGRVIVLPADLALTGAGARRVTFTLSRNGAPVGAFQTGSDSLGQALRVQSVSTLPPGEYSLLVTVRAGVNAAVTLERAWALRVK